MIIAQTVYLICCPAAGGSSAAAHLLAACKRVDKPDQQESFPCSASVDLQDDADADAGEAGNSMQQASASLTPTSGSHASAQQAAQHLLHNSCWGKGLAGLLLCLLPCLRFCLLSEFLMCPFAQRQLTGLAGMSCAQIGKKVERWKYCNTAMPTSLVLLSSTSHF